MVGIIVSINGLGVVIFGTTESLKLNDVVLGFIGGHCLG